MPHTNPRDILRDIRMGRIQPGEVSFQGAPFSESAIAEALAPIERLMEQSGRKGEVAGRRLLALAKLAKASEGAGTEGTLFVHPRGGIISSGEAEQGAGRRLLAQSKLAKAAEGSTGEGVHMVTRAGRLLPVDEAAETILGGGKKADALTELILKNADDVAESAKSQVLTRTGVRHKAAEAAKAIAETVGAPAARSFAQEAAEMGVGTVAGVGASKVAEKGMAAAKAALGGGTAAAGEAAAVGAAEKGILSRAMASGAGRFLLTRALPAVGIAGSIAYLLSKLYNKKVGAPLEMKVSGAQSGEAVASGLMGQTREMMETETEATQSKGLVDYATALQRGMGEAAAQRRFDVGKVLAANQGALAAASVLSRPSYGEMMAMMEGVR